MRERLDLDGTWEFSTPEGPPRLIRVPGAWQAQFDDLRHYAGTARYTRSVQIPAGWQGRRIRLCFGAVDYRAEVWVNGCRVGDHEGGYLPFSFEIQDCVAPGAAARLEVQVTDSTEQDVPLGKQSWYGPLGGIWQSTWLEAVGPAYVAAMRIFADAATGAVAVRPRLAGDTAGCRLRLTVIAPDGAAWSTAPVDAAGAADGLQVTVPDPRLWDLDSPHLYTATVAVLRDGAEADRFSDTFGFRTVAARDGRIWLNGRPIYLAAALDQDYYPDTICTPPSDAFLRRQFELARELGLNCLRCHIKIPDPRYLYRADRAGLLIWQELPSWGELTPAARERVEATLEGMLERDGNHPSIIAWTLVNEGWGTDLPADAGHRRWLDQLAGHARRVDPTRLVVDNSACPPNFHVNTDINDFHWYAALPDYPETWNGFLARWSEDPAITFSPHGDARRRGDEPMVLSEFGNWGLPDLDRLRGRDGRNPWWFDTGQDRDGGVVHPAGVEQRFAEWGLGRVFGDLASLSRSSQEHQFESLQYELEQLRLRPEVAGFVVTEFTDVHWECNGLLDLHRNPKAAHSQYRWLFAPDLPVALPDRRRAAAGEAVTIDLHVAHASDRDLSGAVLSWQFGSQHGALPAAAARWSAPRVGRVTLVTAEPGLHPLHLELRDAAGAIIGRNSLELAVYPEPGAGPRAWTEEPELAAFLAAAGCRLDPGAPVRVAAGLPAGPIPERPCLLLPPLDRPAELGSVRLIPRPGSRWEGNWAQGLHWISGSLRRGTPLRPRLDMTCLGLVPPAVLEGCDPAAALAGLYLGWIRFPAATAAWLGPRTIAATFPLLQAGGGDPGARAILFNLLNLLSREA